MLPKHEGESVRALPDKCFKFDREQLAAPEKLSFGHSDNNYLLYFCVNRYKKFDVTKCLQQIEMPDLLHMCA